MSALSTRDLTVRFGRGQRALTAVDGVSLDIPAGGVLGLVGESGSGKSTLARALVGLVPVSRGRVLLDGVEVTRQALRRVQMVFQDPSASLNPRMTVGDTLAEAVAVVRGRGRVPRDEIGRLLDLVGLDAQYATRLPRELSGGQRQRVAIARALAVSPQVLIADEITSALDASVQSAILNLVRDIQARLGLTVLFISHNLAVIRYVSDAIAVMYLGQVVETAPAAQLVAAPQHPYTRAMLAAVPSVGSGASLDPAALNGGGTMDAEPPDPHAPPPGCRFHTRCRVGPLVHPERTICTTTDPVADAPTRLHHAACHFVPTVGQPARDAGRLAEG